jgi:poly(3-hydroxybutyrate) depolymerase
MRTIFFALLVVVLVGCNENSPGQASNQKGFKNWYIGDFRCGVYIPPTYDPVKKYPMVIYLHGHSDTTSWNFGWYHEPAAMADPVILLTPKCPASESGGWGNSMNPDISPMMKKTFEMIDIIKKLYNVDEDRLYIHGTSMGGIGTFGLIQKYPDMFTAGYAVCGWATPQMAPQLSQLPFWIFHGERDDVVPVEGSRGIYNAVVANGGKQIRYTEFQGVKHDAWNYVNDDKTYRWLLAQKKGASALPMPNKITNVIGKVNGSNILLEWEKPSSIKGLWYFKIFRDNILIGEVDSDQFTFTDSLVTTPATYEYKISVVDYHFKESDLSDGIRVTK